MTNILFYYDNKLDDATLTASSEATGFPIANLQHPHRTKVWETDGSPAGTANVVIDHGSATSVNCVILVNYDWTQAPGTLDLEFNATDSWGSPSHTESLTWAATPTTAGNNAVIVKLFNSQSYRYNRLNVVYSPGGTPTDWSLGRIFLGTYFQPAKDRLVTDNRPGLIDPSYLSQSPGGQDHADEITKYRTKQFSLLITDSEWTTVQTMYNEVGRAKDLFVSLDYDGAPNELTWYCKFAQNIGVRRVSEASRNYLIGQFNIKESR